MVMSPRNKKGDVTISTVILIVLGLAVLVMLIVGFTKGWSFFFDLFDSGPSQLQTVAKACAGYAQASLTIDFCKYRLIETDGKDELVNCNDGRIIQSLNADGVILPGSLTSCTADAQNRQSACQNIAESKRAETMINGAGSCGGVTSIIVDKTSLALKESGEGEINVKLSAKPAADVVINVLIIPANPEKAVANPATLTFTLADWQSNQKIVINPTQDGDTNDDTFRVRVSAVGLGFQDITVTVDDDQ